MLQVVPLAPLRKKSVAPSCYTDLEQSSSGSMNVQRETAGVGTGINQELVFQQS